MAEAIKAKDLPEAVAFRASENKKRASAKKLDDATTEFDGKLFADLTGQEKDDLLKALAISAGIIEG